MALVDEIQASFATHVLAALTNKDDQQALTVNVSFLTRICDRAEETFEVETGTEFDVTNTKHLQCIEDLVMLRLQRHAGQIKQSDYDEKFKAWKESAESYAKTDARDRPLMNTSSEVTRPQENTTGAEKKPDLDRSIWDGVMPNQP